MELVELMKSGYCRAPEIASKEGQDDYTSPRNKSTEKRKPRLMINQTHPPLIPHFLDIQGALMHKARNVIVMVACMLFSSSFDFYERLIW